VITLIVNGSRRQVTADPDTPLLWVLRDEFGLTGTKYGCGISLCGACTVHADGRAVRACGVPVGGLDGVRITTIEGLAPDGDHPLQRAWLAEDVPQCGYCQSGMIMAAAALLHEHPRPSDAEVDARITNLCRCGTYARIRRAIRRADDEPNA
jgi:aerobic-type carbon monoxide dehydrogenase small subunit (CoxS/CutS family)